MWSVRVRRITNIVKIPNADSIECCVVGGWPVVSKKGEYQVGELVVFFPEDSIMPEDLLKELGLVGKLAGKEKNRIKAIKLRGQISVGLILSAPDKYQEGDDVTEDYNISRYEEPIPIQLSGKVRKKHPSFITYDIENLRNDCWFRDGEPVYFLEKLHGTNCAYGLTVEKDGTKDYHVCSRNRSLQEDEANVYWQCFHNQKIKDILTRIRDSFFDYKPTSIWFHGEIIGVQDLKYGVDKPTFVLFDIRIEDTFQNWHSVKKIARQYELFHVPELYCGPFQMTRVIIESCGPETYSTNGNEHIREGIVIRPTTESLHGVNLDRKIQKYVGDDYLLRKNGTELH